MCGRYWLGDSPELEEIGEEANLSPLADRWRKTAEIRTFGEIRPTDVVPVIAPNRDGIGTVYPMKWGYSGRQLLINARAETAAEKPTFREDWARHRCIVSASWYFEWSPEKQKYSIRPKDDGLTWLCGLYRIEGGLPVFVILTREPADRIRFIHDRMPLIMPKELHKEWLRPEVRPEALLPFAQTEMSFGKSG